MRRAWPIVVVPALRRAWPIVVVLALAGFAGPAQAQVEVGQLFAIGGGGKVVSQTTIATQASGQLVVSFHGDAAAGCATYGLCAYAGTIVVRPRAGQLSVVSFRRHGRIGHQVSLLLDTGDSGYSTSARVQRSAPGGQGGTCADAGASSLGTNAAVAVHGGSIAIRLLARGGSLLQTRCAGPVDGDLASVSPAVTVSLARLMRGRTSLDFSATRAFSVHGFAGTISSTLRVTVGKPSRQAPSSGSGSGFPPGIKAQRTRIVTEQLDPLRVTGGLSAAVSGSADPIICGLLDTCGLSGTLTLGQVQRVRGQIVATGPARRPYRDFLTALGRTRGGRSHGISVVVFVNLPGHVQESETQAGATCTDTGGIGGVTVAIGVAGRSNAGGSAFGLSGGGGSLFGAWRTRCPGPLFENVPTAATASLRPAALSGRQLMIHVHGSGQFSEDGYVVSPQGEISVLLRRGRVSSQVLSTPGA